MALSLVDFYAIIPAGKGKSHGKSLPPGKREEKTLDRGRKGPDCLPVSERPCGSGDLAEETGSTPQLILGWGKQAPEGLDQTFSGGMHQQRKVLHREIREKDNRIRKLESVVSELSMENLLLKKAPGTSRRDPRSACDGGRGHKDREIPEGTGRIPHQKVSCRSGSPGSNLSPLDQPFGKAAPSGRRCAQGTLDPAGRAREDRGLQEPAPDCGRSPAGLHDAGPGGCGRLTFHGLPSAQRSRNVREVDSSGRKKSLPARLLSAQGNSWAGAYRHRLYQPPGDTFLFHPRSGQRFPFDRVPGSSDVHDHGRCRIVIQRALETLPKGVAKPRIIFDNGPRYLSTEFRSSLRDQEVVHSRIRVAIPSPTERWNVSTRLSSPNACGPKPRGDLRRTGKSSGPASIRTTASGFLPPSTI